jgi:hypothetical protein
MTTTPELLAASQMTVEQVVRIIDENERQKGVRKAAILSLVEIAIDPETQPAVRDRLRGVVDALAEDVSESPVKRADRAMRIFGKGRQ